MTDQLKEWLRPLDDGDPDADLLVRARTGPRSEEDLSMSSTGRRRAPIRAAAVLVTAILILGLVLYGLRDLGSSKPTAASDPLSSIPAGWTELPEPPGDAEGSSSVWAGDEVIDWGGYTHDAQTNKDTYEAGGFAFDPVSRTWSAIPSAPEGRGGTKAIWTGTSALFLFGYVDSKSSNGGFAFEPATGTWRDVAPAPIGPKVAAVVWTGKEVIAVEAPSTQNPSDSMPAAAYDPTTNTWRTIADCPISLSLVNGVWTGDQVILFGSLLDRGNHAATHTSVGASYDPTSDTWAVLPPSDLSPQATSTAWIGDRMLAWDYLLQSQTFDPGKNTWSATEKMPLEPSECYPDSASLTGYVFAFYCGDAALYDETNGTWQQLDGGVLQATVDANAGSYQLWRFADLIPAESVVFLDASGITVNKNGVPCYGCSGSPTSFWVYRPPGNAVSASSTPPAVQEAPSSLRSTAYTLDRPATEIAATGGYIWAAEGANRTIQKVDPTTGKVVSTIDLDGCPAWLAGGTSELWVAVSAPDDSSWVSGLDPATDKKLVTLPGVTGPLVQTDEGLWAFRYRSPQPNWMVLLDPRTGNVIRQVEVPAQPFEAAASGQSVWLLDIRAGTVDLVSEDGSVRTVTDRSAGTSLASSATGVYLSAWRGESANDQNGPATSAFASSDGQVQPFGNIYNFRPMVVAGSHVWFVAGPNDGNVSGLCGMKTTDGIVDGCADISVSLEGIHDPVAYEPTTDTLWSIAYDGPRLYEVNAR